jgi:hypothetical protein
MLTVFMAALPREIIPFRYFQSGCPSRKRAFREIVAAEGANATLGVEQPLDALDGVVRQIQSTIHMNLQVALDLHQLLTEHLIAANILKPGPLED